METLHEFTGMDDRFSTLSEQLAYHILNFLNIEDLGRLMLVSKRCKSLCVSVPSLTVDNRNYTHNLISRQHFNEFVEKFLALRANSGTMSRHFTMVWSFQGSRCDQNKKRKQGDSFLQSEEYVVRAWLSRYVTFRGVETLSISMVSQEGKPIHFPCFVLRTESLKDLRVCSNNSVLEFPPYICLGFPSQLQSLTLQSAQISDKNLNHAVSELRFLESLYLYDCSCLKRIHIHSSSLKQLKIINGNLVDLCHLYIYATELEKIFLTWYPRVFRSTTFQISCSKLKDFVWYGSLVRYYHSVGNLSHLQCVGLYLTRPPGLEYRSFNKHEVLYILPLERSAKFHRLHAKTIEILYKLGWLNTRLDAVRNLAIDYCFLTNDQVPIIAYFLQRIPCLETFNLMSSATIVRGSSEDRNLEAAVPPKGFGFNVEYWETRGLTFIDQLKKAAVEVHNEEGNDLELVKYLLTHAKGLENLTIVCAPSLVTSISGRLNAFMKASTMVSFRSKHRTEAS